MSLLFVPRLGGKWSVRSKLRGRSAGEPSLLIWAKQKGCHTQNLLPGWRSTCAASVCDLNGTKRQKQHYCLQSVKVKPSFPQPKCKRYRIQYSDSDSASASRSRQKTTKNLNSASLNAFMSTLMVLHGGDCKDDVWWNHNLMSSL